MKNNVEFLLSHMFPGFTVKGFLNDAQTEVCFNIYSEFTINYQEFMSKKDATESMAYLSKCLDEMPLVKKHKESQKKLEDIIEEKEQKIRALHKIVMSI